MPGRALVNGQIFSSARLTVYSVKGNTTTSETNILVNSETKPGKIVFKKAGYNI